eukprot:TRINITY_DN5164_c0_g1_i1.p1 TRINITY_DN5164_c0_g1~~TRINITY_DN5164_c0_g1_i1.p1  ORF type:complete len:341 (-),score=74.37 TRINITY_DN5164_c0_g1_i1:842-1864(-)
MVEFRFNFSISKDDEDEAVVANKSVKILEVDNQISNDNSVISDNTDFGVAKINDIDDRNDICIVNTEEIYVNNEQRMIKCDFSTDSLKLQKSTLEKEEKNENSKDILDISQARDVLDKVYEGGFKIWECTFDLLEYLSTNYGQSSSYELDTIQSIFDIGCGQGLLGIYCYLYFPNITNCDFQDYNSEVLTYLTIPTIIKNAEIKSDNNNDNNEENIINDIKEKCLFYSGDWKKIENKYFQLNEDQHENDDNNNQYDLILTAETLYKEENHQSLYSLIKSSLKRPNGRALIASKNYYFGVGGGINTFEDIVRADNVFFVKRVKSIDNGVSNMRSILELSFK